MSPPLEGTCTVSQNVPSGLTVSIRFPGVNNLCIGFEAKQPRANAAHVNGIYALYNRSLWMTCLGYDFTRCVPMCLLCIHTCVLQILHHSKASRLNQIYLYCSCNSTYTDIYSGYMHEINPTICSVHHRHEDNDLIRMFLYCTLTATKGAIMATVIVCGENQQNDSRQHLQEWYITTWLPFCFNDNFMKARILEL